MNGCVTPKQGKFINSLVPSDESLHSFVLRNQLMFHPEIKPIGVMNHSGAWRDPIFVSKGIQHLFYAYQDHELLHLIGAHARSNMIHMRLDRFPGISSESIERVFFHDNEKLKKGGCSIRVSFCEMCIKESVSEFGYGYFKDEWSYKCECFKHGKELRQLPIDSYSRNLKRIKNILKGEVLESFFCDSPDFSGNLRREDHVKKMHNKKFYPVKAAKCALTSFSEWLALNREHLSEREDEPLVALSSLINKPTFLERNFYKFDLAENVAEACRIIEDENPELIKSYFDDCVEVRRVNIGPRKQGVLVELVSKRKGMSCAECGESYCYMKERDDHELIDNYVVDLPFILKNSYANLKSLDVKLFGSNLWSPFTFNSEVKS